MTIIAPFIGYLILFNQNVVDFLKLSTEVIGIQGHELEAVQVTISRLRQLYVGLMLVGIASIIFRWRCPPLISQHRTIYDYVGAELNIMNSQRYVDVCDRLELLGRKLGNVWQHRVDETLGTGLVETRIQPLNQERPLVWEGWINENRLQLARALAILYDVENDTRSYTRWAITMLYVLGFGLLSWSSFVVFYKVVFAIYGDYQVDKPTHDRLIVTRERDVLGR